MDIKTLGHLSQSSINMYLRCPAQFMYRYLQGLKVPPSGNLTLGKSVDASLDFNYQFKIEAKKDRKTGEILDYYSADFDKRKEETEFKEDEKPGDIKDNGVRVLKEYQTVIAPTLQPVSSQKEVAVQLEAIPVPIVGYIDVIDDTVCVIDNKVKSKSPSKNDAGLYLPTETERVQMSIYENGLMAEGITPKGLRIDSMVTNKVPKVVSATVKTTASDLLYLETLVSQISKIVEAEIFVPNRQGNMCSRRHCGYWHLCVKDFHGEVRE